jgi:Ca2+-binding EF-hand superfamily protein
MVDKNGDGQVAFDEFYRMVTGGREPPPGSRIAARQSIVGDKKIDIPGLRLDGGGGGNASTAELIQLRNTKRKALDKFARDNYLKPESIKRAHRRFQVLDKKKSGVLDYTEFCEVLQVEASIQCEEVFKMYDYNQSGLIDAKE